MAAVRHNLPNLPSPALSPPLTRGPPMLPPPEPASSRSNSSRSSTSRSSDGAQTSGRFVGAGRSGIRAGFNPIMAPVLGRGTGAGADEFAGAAVWLGAASRREGEAGASFWGADAAGCFALLPPAFSVAAAALPARCSDRTSRQLLSAASPRSLFFFSGRSRASARASSALLLIASGPASCAQAVRALSVHKRAVCRKQYNLIKAVAGLLAARGAQGRRSGAAQRAAAHTLRPLLIEGFEHRRQRMPGEILSHQRLCQQPSPVTHIENPTLLPRLVLRFVSS